MKALSVKDARDDFARLIGDAMRGTPTIILRHNRRVAQIAPVRPARRQKLPDLATFRASLGPAVRKSRATIKELRKRDRY